MKIVKRKGHIEQYDEKKVYAAVFAAALNSHHTDQQSEKIAEQVMKKINAFMKKKKATTSMDLRNEIIKAIPQKDVALMYKHHLDLC